MTPRQMRERLQAVKDSIITIAGECMQEKAEEIKELIVSQHEIDFIDSAGSPLRTHFKKYVFDFSSDPSPFCLPTKFMPELTSELDLEINGDTYAFTSPSMTSGGELKTDYLKQWNGSEIMSLTPENEALIYPIIQERFVERVNAELALD